MKLNREEKKEMLSGRSGNLSVLRFLLFEMRIFVYLCIVTGVIGFIICLIREYTEGLIPSTIVLGVGFGIDGVGKGAKAAQRPFERSREERDGSCK